MSDEIPPVLWLGKCSSQWHIYAFTGEASAIAWMQKETDNEPQSRRVWRATISEAVELELKVTAPYFVVKGIAS